MIMFVLDALRSLLKKSFIILRVIGINISLFCSDVIFCPVNKTFSCFVF